MATCRVALEADVVAPWLSRSTLRRILPRAAPAEGGLPAWRWLATTPLALALTLFTMTLSGARAFAAPIRLTEASIAASSGTGNGGPFILSVTIGQLYAEDMGSPMAAKSLELPSQVVHEEPVLAPVPDHFELFANAPNPFNQQTTIRYAIPASPSPTPVSLRIYDLAGRQVRDLDSGLQSQGIHAAVWDGRDGNGNRVSGGIYFYRIVAGQFAAHRRLVVAH